MFSFTALKESWKSIIDTRRNPGYVLKDASIRREQRNPRRGIVCVRLPSERYDVGIGVEDVRGNEGGITTSEDSEIDHVNRDRCFWM